MKILIICTFFPPDTNIAAKRPYMFAKYLAYFGHDVTVICSGKISAKKDKSYNDDLNTFRIIRYLKTDSENIKPQTSTLAHRNSELVPSAIREMVKGVYHSLYEPINIYRTQKKSRYHYNSIKIALDSIKQEHFDVVYSTYSELSNVYAGEYAKDLFKCKWVLDFRDRIVQLSNRSWLWNTLYKPLERKCIVKADAVTAVSEDLFYGTSYSSSHIYTIYNGYEPIVVDRSESSKNRLSICYTGMVYGERSLALESLFKALFSLKEKGQIELDKVAFEYAGPSGEDVNKMAHKYGLSSIINQHGYLLSKELNQLQADSDIFLVLSWNRDRERGILTGKFYDGLNVKRPILSILAGDTMDSELYRLNEQYHYGFCYEQARGNQQDDEFESFISELYKQKIEQGQICYRPNDRLVNNFKYVNLTKELESLCLSLFNG